MKKTALLLSAVLFSFTLSSQVDIGVGLGGTLSFPRAQQTAGLIILNMDTDYETNWKERWMIAAFARYELSKTIRFELSVEHRSPAYLIGNTTIGKRGIFTPLKLEIELERNLYLSLGCAPYLYYREYQRRDGDFFSRRLDDPEIQLAFLSGLVYDINDRFSILAHYAWDNEVFAQVEVYQNFTAVKLADIEVRMNQVSLLLRMRLSTVSDKNRSLN